MPNRSQQATSPGWTMAILDVSGVRWRRHLDATMASLGVLFQGRSAIGRCLDHQLDTSSATYVNSPAGEECPVPMRTYGAVINNFRVRRCRSEIACCASFGQAFWAAFTGDCRHRRLTAGCRYKTTGKKTQPRCCHLLNGGTDGATADAPATALDGRPKTCDSAVQSFILYRGPVLRLGPKRSAFICLRGFLGMVRRKERDARTQQEDFFMDQTGGWRLKQIQSC